MATLFRRSNGIYYLATHHNGHRVSRSTGKRRKIHAEKYLRSLDRQDEQKPRIGLPQLTFQGFVPEWRTYAEANFTRSTIREDSGLGNGE